MNLQNPSQITVIAATYNQPKDLRVFLESMARQSVSGYQLIITDDGSGAETQTVIAWARTQPWARNFLHLWQEDQGFRKSKILNEAIRRSTGEWLVFVDTDSVVHPRFVEDHKSRAGAGKLFMGRRVDLGKGVSDWIRNHPAQILTSEFYARILGSTYAKDTPTRNARRSFRIGSPFLQRILKNDQVPDLLGSNFSVDRELLFKVNGFDEEMIHYWGEDGDLFWRLRNAGAEISGRKSFAIQWHLWHPRRSAEPGAEAEYQRRIQDDRSTIWCPSGIAQEPSQHPSAN